MIGKTIKKEMKADKFFDGTQIRATMIKEATGVIFTTVTSGESSCLTSFHFAASTPKTTAAATAMKNPIAMRDREKRIDCQKPDCIASEKSLDTTETGDAKSISCLTAMLAICHTKIQNAAHKNFVTVLVVIIERFIGDIPSHGVGILIVKDG